MVNVLEGICRESADKKENEWLQVNQDSCASKKSSCESGSTGPAAVSVTHRKCIDSSNMYQTWHHICCGDSSYIHIVQQVKPNSLCIAAKWVLRWYLKSTSNCGIVFWGGQFGNFTGYSDTDWAGDNEERKSMSGNLFKAPV